MQNITGYGNLVVSGKNIPLFSAGFEKSIESLVATDVQLLVELSNVNTRVTNLNSSLTDVDVRVTDLDTELSVLQDTVSQIDVRVSQIEVSGKLLCSNLLLFIFHQRTSMLFN